MTDYQRAKAAARHARAQADVLMADLTATEEKWAEIKAAHLRKLRSQKQAVADAEAAAAEAEDTAESMARMSGQGVGQAFNPTIHIKEN